MNNTVTDNTNDLQKVTFLEERIDQMSSLFRGSEFRLSSLEYEYGQLSTDFKKLVITFQNDVESKLNYNNIESQAFNQK